MAAPFKNQELAFSSETAFAEDVSTWSHRIPILGSPTLTLTQERITDGGLRSRSNEESLSHPGPRTAELTFTCRAIGHLTTAAGALTETWQHLLIRRALGGNTTSGVGTTISGTASASSSVIDVTSAASYAAGEVIRVGSKGDGKGDGMAVVIGSINTGATPDAITLLTALPATPSTAGHVVYATQLAYPDETAIGSLTTVRFICSHTTTGAQYILRGGQLSALALNITPQEMPTYTFTFRFAYWQRSADTTPSARSLLDDFSAPVAGGRFAYHDSTTPSTVMTALTAANINFTITRDLQPIIGPQGTWSEQFINGWAPTMTKAALTFDVPWSTTFETIWDTANQSALRYGFLFQNCSTDGRVVGFYIPSAHITGARPTLTEVNGQDYQTISFAATDPASGTELQRSGFRLFHG